MLLGSSLDSKSIIVHFDFKKIDEFNQARKKFGTANWKLLNNACIELDITPPTFCSNSSQTPPSLYFNHRNSKLNSDYSKRQNWHTIHYVTTLCNTLQYNTPRITFSIFLFVVTHIIVYKTWSLLQPPQEKVKLFL